MISTLLYSLFQLQCQDEGITIIGGAEHGKGIVFKEVVNADGEKTHYLGRVGEDLKPVNDGATKAELERVAEASRESRCNAKEAGLKAKESAKEAKIAAKNAILIAKEARDKAKEAAEGAKLVGAVAEEAHAKMKCSV